MKLGLMTAAFPTLTLEEVAEWSAANGFETLEIASWPAASGEHRRYAGVSHIDVDRLDERAVHDLLDRHHLAISSLAYYPNNLDGDAATVSCMFTATMWLKLRFTVASRDPSRIVPEK